MLLISLIYLLVSNAVTIRRDKYVLFSRVVITTLLLISFLAYNNLYINQGILDLGFILHFLTIAVTLSIASYLFFKYNVKTDQLQTVLGLISTLVFLFLIKMHLTLFRYVSET